MDNMMKQVMMTYVTRRAFWLVVAGYIGHGAFVYGLADQEFGLLGAQPLLPMVIVLGCTLGLHLMVQFANPRAKLLPGFAEAHLRVAMLWVTLGVVLYSAWIARCYGIGPMGWSGGVLGVAMAGFGVLSWMMWAKGWVATALSMPAIALFANPSLSGGVLDELMAGEWPLVGVGLLVLGVGLCVAVGWRAVTMEESDRVYQSCMPGGSGAGANVKTFTRRAELKAVREKASTSNMAKGVDRLCGDEWASGVGRAKLIKLSFGSAFGLGLMASAMAIGWWVPVSFYQSKTVFEAEWLGGQLFVFGQVFCLVSLQGAHFLILRGNRTGNDWLKPMSRKQMVEGVLKNFGRMVAVAWLMATLVVLGVFASGKQGPVNAEMVWFVVLSGIFQMFGVGLCFWLAAKLSRLRLLLLGGPVMFGVYGLLMAGVGNRGVVGDVGLVLMAIGCVVLGWWMMRRGVRSWCEVELG